MFRSSKWSARNVIVITALALVAAGCGDGADTSTTESSTSATAAPTTSSPSTTTTTKPATVDVQAEIDWFVTVLNGTDLTEDEYETRFADSFRAQVPYDTGIVPILEQLHPQGPFSVVERAGGPSRGQATVETADGTRANIIAEVDPSGQFIALLIQPADTPSLEDPPVTVAEAFDRLAQIGSTGAITAEVVDGACQPLDVANADTPVPLGSAFKLYVLAALGEAVAEGDVSWDDELTIRDELKSIPSGVLQDREAGDVVTVGEAAELMISISDNTATDHLIDLLGRETVEGVLLDYGNSTPELNTPFLTTRELAALKIGPASGLRVQWIDGDEETRRALLVQISDITPADLPIQEWVEPVDPDKVEWFASPADLCQLAVRLIELNERVPEVGEILSINPGIPAEEGTWESIWFKGGSEPGLVATWFVTETGGRTYVTAASVVDPDEVIDQQTAILLMAAARDLVAP